MGTATESGDGADNDLVDVDALFATVLLRSLPLVASKFGPWSCRAQTASTAMAPLSPLDSECSRPFFCAEPGSPLEPSCELLAFAFHKAIFMATHEDYD